MEIVVNSTARAGLRPLTGQRNRSLPAGAAMFAFMWSLACPIGAQAQSAPDLGFTTRVSATLITQFAQKFTAAARDLLARWMDFTVAQKANPFMQRLDAAKGREAGVLALFAIGGLDEINRAVGLTKGNEVLKQFSDTLAAPAAGFTPLVGRWQGRNVCGVRRQ